MEYISRKKNAHFARHKLNTRVTALIQLEYTQPNKKLQAIQAATVPTDASQLRAFIGLMNYYGKFIPHISTHLAPLYTLLEKEHTWSWTEDCEASFRKCKTLLTNDTVLVHYDNKLPIKLACDASSYGVGAVLSHVFKDGERPIAFASRTLTKAERNYGQIEKEALALFFGVISIFMVAGLRWSQTISRCYQY